MMDENSEWEGVNPGELGPPKGWTNGMFAPARGRILFVAGQDAATAEGSVVEEDFVRQFEIALVKTLTVVREVGGEAESIGRMTVFVTDLGAYREGRKAIGEVWRAEMGRHYPAMSLIEVSRLLDPIAKVEIEATAVI